MHVLHCRNGFLRDCAQVAPESNILSPNFADPYDLDSHHFYVHHTGTALVQPVVEQLHAPPAAIPATSSSNTLLGDAQSPVRAGHHQRLLHPYPTVASTPLVLSPAKSTHSVREGREGREGSVGREGREGSVGSKGAPLSDVTENGSHSNTSPGNMELRYGFYWHKNYLLPKQKNVPPGLVGRYSEVFETFRNDCQNKDGILNHLCDLLFT